MATKKTPEIVIRGELIGDEDGRYKIIRPNTEIDGWTLEDGLLRYTGGHELDASREYLKLLTVTGNGFEYLSAGRWAGYGIAYPISGHRQYNLGEKLSIDNEGRFHEESLRTLVHAFRELTDDALAHFQIEGGYPSGLEYVLIDNIRFNVSNGQPLLRDQTEEVYDHYMSVDINAMATGLHKIRERIPIAELQSR